MRNRSIDSKKQCTFSSAQKKSQVEKREGRSKQLNESSSIVHREFEGAVERNITLQEIVAQQLAASGLKKSQGIQRRCSVTYSNHKEWNGPQNIHSL